MKKRLRLQAFTLAEILITLSVIGLIAMLTITKLIPSVEHIQYVTAWKKLYSELNQAYAKLVLENDGSIKNLVPDVRETKDSQFLNIIFWLNLYNHHRAY